MKRSCFLWGLSDEIRLPVRMFNPKTMPDAYALAKMQEELMLNSRKSTKLLGSIAQARGPQPVSSYYNPK
jgi:hypothetical protein